MRRAPAPTLVHLLQHHSLQYQKRISGPTLDRIDIQVEVAMAAYEEVSGDGQRKTSVQIRARVEATGQRRRERFNATKLPMPLLGTRDK